MQFAVIIPSTHKASGSEGTTPHLQLISNIDVNESDAAEATGRRRVFPLFPWEKYKVQVTSFYDIIKADVC